jgi:hypothetical protein
LLFKARSGLFSVEAGKRLPEAADLLERQSLSLVLSGSVAHRAPGRKAAASVVGEQLELLQ